MFLGSNPINKSTFLSSEKDLAIIVNKILENDTLKKLLFYQDESALDKPNLTKEETLSLINKNIRLVPRVDVDPEVKSYIIIGFDNFTPNPNNPKFRDNIITFDIICHLDNWSLGDLRLRPYKIMGELDGMFGESKMTGIGTLEFVGANELILNDEIGGYTLTYMAIHGGEDVAKHE